MSRQVFLSVDFDYFSREEEEWDWGHAEMSLFQQLAWHSRVGLFGETSLEKYALPHPRDFWQTLASAGFNFDPCRSFNVADSHLWACPNFLDLAPGQVEIVNFDAHHDMGYKDWKELKTEWLDKDKVDCSNWLLYLLYKYPQLTASCVYPQWKGLREIERGMPWEKRPGIKKRFNYGVFNNELLRKLAGDVVGIFVAKSSAWLPPWHDKAFAEFSEAGADFAGLSVEVPFEDDERVNPLKVRDFDMAGALAYDAKLKALKNELRGVDRGGDEH